METVIDIEFYKFLKEEYPIECIVDLLIWLKENQISPTKFNIYLLKNSLYVVKYIKDIQTALKGDMSRFTWDAVEKLNDEYYILDKLKLKDVDGA